MEITPSPTQLPSEKASENKTKAPFFRVSTRKFVILSICTLSLYELYWFYKNWQLIKIRERNDISPAIRSIFAFFFCYQVFCKVRDYPANVANNNSLAAGALATGWILTTLLWKLPDPYWLICFSAVIFMVPVQMAAERVNAAAAPLSATNDRFSGINWLTILVGGVFLFLAVIGTFLGDK
jgi:hypothetical protein